MERSQKEYYLNEQMQAIQKELGEKDDYQQELAELEEKAAKKLATIVSDVRLDLDEVGSHLANLPNVAYRRLSEVVDSADSEKEGKYDREHIPHLF
jgi:ATP-dependent Lon protease